jgi:4-hydroxybenzoate polyprenyltransferase
MLRTIRLLLELVRFSHTIFALPFALLSAAIAWKHEPFRTLDLLGILLAMVTARNFAMAFNRLVDRHLDARNPRTAMRHLPAGTLSVRLVTGFVVGNAIAFLAVTGIFLLREPTNPWPLYLSAPVLAFLAGYSFTKRLTSLAHFWLGTALMLAPIAAWIAIRGPVELASPLMLGCVVLFWVSGFDILYACQDVAFDQTAKLHSVPARFGVRGSLRIAAACHLVMFAILGGLMWVEPLLRGLVFQVGWLAVGGLLIYEHAIVSANDLSKVNRAFLHVNSVISLGLLAVGIVQLALN